MTLAEAKKILTDKGMVKSHSVGSRSYWTLGEGKDVLLDHSATITNLGNRDYHISDFT